MKAAQSRRLAQLELSRRARTGGDEAVLLAWLAKPESRQEMETAAAAGFRPPAVPDDVLRAGQRVVNAKKLRLRTTEAEIETMSRSELVAVVVCGP